MTNNSVVRSLGVFGETLRRLLATQQGACVNQQKLGWAERVLRLLRVEVEVRGVPSTARPLVFVGNHIGYLDIPLLLSRVPDASFVAKEELASWPLFGAGMRRAGTIFVKRESPRSRGNASERLREAFSLGRAMAVFPAGTTSLNECKPWKAGIFRLAAEAGVPVQPFRIRFDPLRPAAFIGEDAFLPHLFAACRQRKFRAVLEFGPVEVVADPRETAARLKAWAGDSGL